MEKQIFPQTTIAVIWDFDETLIPGSMQKPIFQEYGVDESTFWLEVNNLSKYYAGRDTVVGQSSAYLNHMLTYVAQGEFGGLNNKKLEKMGGELTFFEGLPSFFDLLKNKALDEREFRKYEIDVELYVVSTGLARMIKGSKIASYLDGVWGCEFIEEVAMPGYLTGEQHQLMKAEPELKQIGYFLDDTTKTRAIFEINKGVNKYSDITVNSRIPFGQRRVPFTNMVYVADGPSDIPVFSLLKQYGGRTYAVYRPQSEAHFESVYQLQRQERIEACGPADYADGTQTSMWIVRTIKDIASRIVAEKQHALRLTVKTPPGHIESNALAGETTLQSYT